MAKKTYVIDPSLCTECIGFYKKPTCVKVCPINCIEVDPNHVETEEDLIVKFKNIYKL